VADPHEAYVLETAGHHWVVKPVKHTLGISNVYSVETDWAMLSSEAETYAIEQSWWPSQAGRFNFAEAYTALNRSEGSGAMRRRRSCAVLSQRAGGVDARTMMALLSDHSDSQSPTEPFQPTIKPHTGICVHSNDDGSGGNTAASLVADLCADGSRLPVYWCSFYSPCLSIFLPYFVEGNLPSSLANGAAAPSHDSPWWRFHQLSHMARAGSPLQISLIRETWATFQNQLFETAYQIAAEGRCLLDRAETDQATCLLTGYMADNVSKMAAMVSAMLDE
jgi:dipeptidase